MTATLGQLTLRILPVVYCPLFLRHSFGYYLRYLWVPFLFNIWALIIGKPLYIDYCFMVYEESVPKVKIQ